jgi:hypothetical protein
MVTDGAEHPERPTMSHGEVRAYLDAVDWLVDVIRLDEVCESWNQPSVLAHYSVGGVAAHAVHSVIWLEQVLDDTAPAGLREVTLAEFFGPNRVDPGAGDDRFAAALRSAAEAFALTGAALVADACVASRAGLANRLAETPAARPIPVIRVPGGQVPLHTYLRTRVLEVVVHGDDVACSVVGLETPDPPRAAVDVTLGVCLELARARVGDLGALRAFVRAARCAPDALRVL